MRESRVEGRQTTFPTFAEAVDGGEAHERRWDLLREAQFSLREWDRHRRREDAVRCYCALLELAALVEASADG